MQDEGGGPDIADTTLSARKEQARGAFRVAIAEAQSTDNLAHRVDDLVNKIFDKEADGSYPSTASNPRRPRALADSRPTFDSRSCDRRRRLKANTNWFKLKLETSRNAGETLLKQKAIEISANCEAKFAREFDDKLRALADGASLEEG